MYGFATKCVLVLSAFCQLLYEITPRQQRSLDTAALLVGLRWDPASVRRPLTGSVNDHPSHLGITCGRCGKAWEDGPVWKCAYRLDYQECDKCHEKHDTDRINDHIFIKVRTSGGGLGHMIAFIETSSKDSTLTTYPLTRKNNLTWPLAFWSFDPLAL